MLTQFSWIIKPLYIIKYVGPSKRRCHCVLLDSDNLPQIHQILSQFQGLIQDNWAAP